MSRRVRPEAERGAPRAANVALEDRAEPRDDDTLPQADAAKEPRPPEAVGEAPAQAPAELTGESPDGALPRRRRVRTSMRSVDAMRRPRAPRAEVEEAETPSPTRQAADIPAAAPDAGAPRSRRRGERKVEPPPLEDAAPEASLGERPPRRIRGDGGPEPTYHPVALDEAKIDPDVQKVVRRLVRHGHEAYLVGGCVRDLLLGRRPKDFDVATSARPEQVRDLFRNSRIIGRRFRLVHVLFQGGKVIEVATFRRNPKDDRDEEGGIELLIRSDNAFGAAHEDATRRDFTINALFYDCEAREMLDWVGGMADIERKVVHTIGDPETRFREDPIRILRALKFAGRLGLGITPDVYDAIVYCRETLALAARPRLSEEIMRLLRGGAARRTIFLAWETGVLDVILPELSALLYDDDGEGDGPRRRVFRLLDAIDARAADGALLDDTVLWAVLLLEPLREALEGVRDRSGAAADFLEPLIDRLAISRRQADGVRRIVAIMPRLAAGRVGRFARTDIFGSALEVTLADLRARGEPTDVVERLRGQAARAPRVSAHSDL